MLEILYEDDDLIAINKPHGLLVHRSSIAADTSEFALQLLRDQIGKTVYPAHRLDRKTAGILLFSLTKEMDSAIQQAFANNQMAKSYLAVLRGYAPPEGSIDYALKKENGTLQDALTHYQTLQHTEIDLPFGKFPTSRYSLVKANPQTGRMHQLRRHFAHILHPSSATGPMAAISKISSGKKPSPWIPCCCMLPTCNSRIHVRKSKLTFRRVCNRSSCALWASYSCTIP